ncbi:MAG: ATP-binding protein [Bacillota bacterium]|nr:ATP-binding protein [Bacillota bacterium]
MTHEDLIQLKENLKLLRLKEIEQIFEPEAERATRENSSYIEYLARLVQAEVERKTDASIDRKIQIARFPRQWPRQFRPVSSASSRVKAAENQSPDHQDVSTDAKE